MTKRGRRKHTPRLLPIVVQPQARCESCGRYRITGEICWHCNPPEPTHCHCEDSVITSRPGPSIDLARELAPGKRDESCGGHVHLRHAWLERQWQLDVESVDESILLPTEMWEDDEVQRSRQAWRDDPTYKAWLRRHPQLRERARRGVESLYAYFELAGVEGAILSKDAQGYTVAGIAEELGYRPGGVEHLLASARSKVAAKMGRLSRAFARVS